MIRVVTSHQGFTRAFSKGIFVTRNVVPSVIDCNPLSAAEDCDLLLSFYLNMTFCMHQPFHLESDLYPPRLPAPDRSALPEASRRTPILPFQQRATQSPSSNPHSLPAPPHPKPLVKLQFFPPTFPFFSHPLFFPQRTERGRFHRRQLSA